MSENVKTGLVFIVSISASVGGVLFAACVKHNALDGGRGGAIGTAIALAFMLFSRDYGSRLYVAVTRRLPDEEARIKRLEQKQPEPLVPEKIEVKVAEIEKHMNQLAAAMTIDARGQRVQNGFIVSATFIGTIIWGFGDWAAQYLIQHPWH